MVARMSHSERGHGVDRGVLDSGISDSGSTGNPGLFSQLSSRQTCTRAQERCGRLPVVAVPALGGTAARFVSTRGCDLPSAFLAPSPGWVGRDGGRAHPAYAESLESDESATAPRAK